MKTALFGGTFNPPHLAHVDLIREVLASTSYQRIVVVPVNRPAHKELDLDPGPEKRLLMTRLACASIEGCVVEDWETVRGGVSYTVDTVKQLISTYKLREKAGLLVGYDLVEELPTWKSWKELKHLVQFIIARRDSETIDAEFTAKLDCIVLENPLIDLSSSHVRSLCAEGKSFAHLLPKQVAEYIQVMGLYGYSS